jgi:UDPglucose--hexose-1-phosphate uridylyltransferase
MSVDEIDRVIERWQTEVTQLSQSFKWVQVFENKGHLMGCSNPHPHCQVWATDFLPNEVVKEKKSQEQFFERTKKVLLEEYRDREMIFSQNSKDGDVNNRVVVENDFWVVLVCIFQFYFFLSCHP